MIMKYKYLIVVLFFVGITSLSYGQTEVKPEFKKVERTNVKNSDKKLYQPIKVSSNVADSKRIYYWNDQAILEKLNVNTIPIDYPKYNVKISKSANLNLIDAWTLKNKHLLKD
jgi:hypothetical protein